MKSLMIIVLSVAIVAVITTTEVLVAYAQLGRTTTATAAATSVTNTTTTTNATTTNATTPSSPTGGGLDGELSAEVQRNIEETIRNRAATTTPPPAGEQAQQQGVIIDRPTAARLAAEDPYFARFEQVLDMCMHRTVSGTVSMTATQCRDSLKQGADRWCGIEFFDALKCEYATALVASYNRLVGTFGNQEIPSFGELFPGEPNPFSTTTPP